jgi:hypothetical protein
MDKKSIIFEDFMFYFEQLNLKIDILNDFIQDILFFLS